LAKRDFLLYHARTGFDLNIQENYLEFIKSWIYKDGHCYDVVNANDSPFKILLNFPNPDKLISEKIVQLVNHLDETDIIPEVL